jgi:phospholipid transport system substrate-binding protein
MRRYLTTFISLTFLLLGGVKAAHAIADDLPAPQQMIVDSTGKLISALVTNRDAIKLDRSIADQLVSEHVLPFIDFKKASQLVLGKYWRRATDEQKTNFTREFSTFLTNNYTTAMVEFTDEIVRNSKNLKYIPLRGADDKYANVRMEVILPNRAPVQVTYSMVNTDESWKVYDISIEGISLAKTYRSQFANQIRRQGLNELIQTLADRNIARAEKTAANNEQ